jgi:hypothetical protein
MEVVHERCCGLDIHKKLIVACAIVPGKDGQPHKQIRSFGSMSDDLAKLSDWLTEQAVSHVAMESTGSFWKPVFNVLEERFELLLINAQHLKAVPGARLTSRTPSGSPTCWDTACSSRASYPIVSSVSSASWCATGPA